MVNSHYRLFLLVICFINLLFLFNCGTTGNYKIDDEKADKIYEYIKVAEKYEKAEDLESALLYYNKAVDMLLSMKLRDKNYCGSLLYDMALLSIDLHKYNDSLTYLKMAYSEIENETEIDTFLVPSIYYTTGWVYSNIDEYKKAEDYYQCAISTYLSEKKIDYIGLSNTYFALAYMYQNNGETTKAEKYFIEMLKIYEDNNCDDCEQMGEILYRIGYFYMEIEEYSKANQNFFQCIEISEKCYNFSRISDSFACIGYIYYEQNEIDKSIECYEKSLNEFLTHDPDNCNAIGKGYYDLGSIYYHSENYTVALQYFENAKESYLECENLEKAEEMNNYCNNIKDKLKKLTI